MIPSTLRTSALPPSEPSSSLAPQSAHPRPSITIPSYNGPTFQGLGSRNGAGFIDPQSSPFGMAHQSPFTSSTPLTSPFQQQDHGGVPYSPLMSQYNPGGMPPSSFISPSIGLASLTILTPQRPLPESLPPTPQIASQPSPRVNPFSISEEGNNPVVSLSGNPLPSLRSGYAKMLKRQSGGTTRKTNMPPPLSPIVTKPQNAPEVWDSVNGLFNNCENEEGPAAQNDSLYPPYGSGIGMGIGGGGIASHLGADNEAALKDLQQALTSPMSPALQQPLNTDPTSFLATFQSPAVVPYDDFEAISSAPPSYGPSPDILVSPCEPSPQSMWGENGMTDLKLFHEVSQASQHQFSSPITVQQPALGLHKDANPSSQESSASSSGSNLPISSSAPTLTSMSPSANKRPRLHPYATTSSSSHRRHASASSGSSAAPSPYIGTPNSTKPNGYRKNVKPTDLLSLEAPIQPRKYTGPSTTARKEVPSSVARTFNSVQAPLMTRKRSSDQAGLAARDDAQQDGHHMDSSSSDGGPSSSLVEGSPAMASTKDELAEHIKEKRRLNTLAARKTRQRKAQFAEEMKETVARLTRENEQLEQERAEWQARAEQAETMLLSLGMRLPWATN
ncbi:hypothetical protein FRB95_006437 [Tulasnella sp. JGI-2019a]|nr:hypothetical protein FRB95_006437 [Tulasnella sp. JGI-2019a]